MNRVKKIRGNCRIHSKLSLDELSILLSERIFVGANFTYGERSIWQEIPSKFIDRSFLGMLVVIGGNGGAEGFTLSIQQYGYPFNTITKTYEKQ